MEGSSWETLQEYRRVQRCNDISRESEEQDSSHKTIQEENCMKHGMIEGDSAPYSHWNQVQTNEWHIVKTLKIFTRYLKLKSDTALRLRMGQSIAIIT